MAEGYNLSRKAVQQLSRTVREVEKISSDLRSDKSSRRSGTGGSKTYLCRIYANKGLGIYEVDVLTDPSSPYTSSTYRAILTAFDMSFQDMFRTGDMVVATAFQVSAYTPAEEE